MAMYKDSNGNSWQTAEEALEDFLSDLPSLTEDETETVFGFTRRESDAAFNLRAIAQGIHYAGMHDRFEGDNYPVPEIVTTSYVAMWNTPGCLPEMEPATFATIPEAWAYILEEIERGWDADPEDEEGEWIAAHAAIHSQDSCEVGSFIAGNYAYSVSVSA